jgi:hypothetical protein
MSTTFESCKQLEIYTQQLRALCKISWIILKVIRTQLRLSSRCCLAYLSASLPTSVVPAVWDRLRLALLLAGGGGGGHPKKTQDTPIIPGHGAAAVASQ